MGSDANGWRAAPTADPPLHTVLSLRPHPQPLAPFPCALTLSGGPVDPDPSLLNPHPEPSPGSLTRALTATLSLRPSP
eukprot:3756989-Prymnesium_polylepis.1